MASKLKARDPDEVEPGKTKGMIFGAPGCGKTWFTLDFPGLYFIDTEGGASLAHYQAKLKASGGKYFGVADGSLDFDEVIEQVKALATETHDRKTLVIDSITKLFQHRIAIEQERLGDKDAFGASKKPAVACMRRLVNWIDRIDMNVWFISHETTEWGKSETSGQREEVGKMADIWDKLTYEFHLSLRIINKGKIYPSFAFVSKSRLLGFQNGDSFPLTYEEFSKRYGKQFIESVSKPLNLVSKEDVAEIIRLSDIYKISDDEKEKLLSKAKCDRWEDLDSERAKKVIEWLNNKSKKEVLK